MTTDGSELSLVLEKKSNFDWTPSPQVPKSKLSMFELFGFIANNAHPIFSLFLQLFIDCIKELQSENPLRVNTGLLLGTAAFERALGDVGALCSVL